MSRIPLDFSLLFRKRGDLEEPYLDSNEIVLVTGASGYVGMSLVDHLLENSEGAIIGLDQVDSPLRHERYLHVTLDLLRENNLRNYFKQFSGKRIKIFHLAAKAYVAESFEKPVDYIQANIIGTINLVSAVPAESRVNFVFASTCSLFASDVGLISETSKVNPINPYAATKFAVERYLQDVSSTRNNFRVSVLRFFNVAGSKSVELRERHLPETHIIPNVISSLSESRHITVFGQDFATKDGHAVRDFIDIRDLTNALYLAGARSHGPNFEDFNIGSGVGVSVREIIDLSADLMGKNAEISYAERRHGDPDSLVADNSKAEKLLNWRPRFGIVETLQSVIEVENASK